VVALIAVIRSYRSPRVRAWTDEVAGELAKVKWPNKKEVTSSTLTVLAASAIATTYLALLDRLWGFVTNLVYGTGT
jgi:preprotein translocase subunit SecE